MENPIRRILSDAVAVAAGISPLTGDVIYGSAEESLRSLPPAEARAAKRKFRKLWRRAAKRHAPGTSLKYFSTMSSYMGLGAPEPTHRHKRWRKIAVFDAIGRRVDSILEGKEGQ